MLPVLIAIVVISIGALLVLRWFARYRYTEAWRRSEFRDWSFGFLMWFGGLFGHRLPPPPQAKVEFATKREADNQPGSDGPSFPKNAPDEEE